MEILTTLLLAFVAAYVMTIILVRMHLGYWNLTLYEPEHLRDIWKPKLKTSGADMSHERREVDRLFNLVMDNQTLTQGSSFIPPQTQTASSNSSYQNAIWLQNQIDNYKQAMPSLTKCSKADSKAKGCLQPQRSQGKEKPI